MNKTIIVATAIFAAIASAPVSADWSIIGLGTLGGKHSFAYDINDSGQVVGSSYVSGANFSQHAFVTGPDGLAIKDLGTFGGTYSSANGINNLGQVVGLSSLSGNLTAHAFIADANNLSAMVDLGTIGTHRLSGSSAVDINESGQIVGTYGSYSLWNPHPFITDSNGSNMTSIPVSLGRSTVGINDNGLVLSARSVFDTNSGLNTHLGTLGGNKSIGYDINNSDQMVGGSGSATGWHAFIKNGISDSMIDLGTLGGSYSNATGINDLGQVIGVADTLSLERHAFLYSHGGMTDLSLLDPVITGGWSNLYVSAINNNNQIAGYGKNLEGNIEAFILSYTPDTIFTPQPIFVPDFKTLTPVPEPSTYAMLLAGLGLVGFMVRRQAGV